MDATTIGIVIGVVAVLVAAVVGAWQIILARKQLQPNKLGATISPPFPQSEYKSSPTPKQIMTSIEKIPPFQQNDARRSYISIGVQWYLTFFGVEESESIGTTGFLLYLRDELEPVIVYSMVDIKQYPELKIMHPGRRMWIAGKIEKVDPLWIMLSDVKLSISEK